MDKTKITSFELLKDLKEMVDSILFDSGTVIATIECRKGNKKVCMELRVAGYVSIIYKEQSYHTAFEFPKKLKEIIKNDPQWWEHRDIILINNNWFEYIYDYHHNGEKWSDGILEESDLTKMTEDELKNEMLELCEFIMQ